MAISADMAKREYLWGREAGRNGTVSFNNESIYFMEGKRDAKLDRIILSTTPHEMESHQKFDAGFYDGFTSGFNTYLDKDPAVMAGAFLGRQKAKEIENRVWISSIYK